MVMMHSLVEAVFFFCSDFFSLTVSTLQILDFLILFFLFFRLVPSSYEKHARCYEIKEAWITLNSDRHLYKYNRDKYNDYIRVVQCPLIDIL